MAEDALQNPVEEKEMTVWDHISEMRSRLLKGVGALVLTTVACLFYLAPRIIEWLAIPGGGLDQFVAIEVTETVGVYMRVSLLGGFIMALPVIVYQILAFIVPGLYDNEKRWVFIAIPVATLLFISGVAFAYYVMLPAALPFLRGFLEDVTPSWRLANYFSFTTNLMFWIGASFEAPLIVYILARFNVVNARMLLKQWRFAVVIIAIIAAMITPTIDPVNMGLLMLPLFAIYFLSVFFAAVAGRHRKETAA